MECPWGGSELEMSRLDTWSMLAFVSLAYIFIYPLGVPVLMYLIMRHQGVPTLAKHKIGGALITGMIHKYLQHTTSASSQRLASFIGMPPGLSNREDFEDGAENPSHTTTAESLDLEFDRRVQVLFVNIFPDHAQCGAHCEGHELPDVPSKILAELGHPVDISRLTLEAKYWFTKIDTKANNELDLQDLLREFGRLGISQAETSQLMKFHHSEGSEGMTCDDFIGAIIHILVIAFICVIIMCDCDTIMCVIWV